MLKFQSKETTKNIGNYDLYLVEYWECINLFFILTYPCITLEAETNTGASQFFPCRALTPPPPHLTYFFLSKIRGGVFFLQEALNHTKPYLK